MDIATTQGSKLFGERIAAKFYWQVKRDSILLATHPHLGAVEPLLENRRRAYRSFVVHEHFKLVYYIDEKQQILYIVALWDTRREPSTLAKQIKSK
ncbi:MAG: type II toxin-antitoxin system RelE/ParE family toxin [Bacteroides sp.]|nr:type II toxin-antitoxin system RelE/ParE family toxin [Bacteroides sp.]